MLELSYLLPDTKLRFHARSETSVSLGVICNTATMGFYLK